MSMFEYVRYLPVPWRKPAYSSWFRNGSFAGCLNWGSAVTPDTFSIATLKPATRSPLDMILSFVHLSKSCPNFSTSSGYITSTT